MLSSQRGQRAFLLPKHSKPSLHSSCLYSLNSSCLYSLHSSCLYSLNSSCLYSLHSSCLYSLHSSCLYSLNSSCLYSLHSSCLYSLHSSCLYSLHSSCLYSLHSSCLYSLYTVHPIHLYIRMCTPPCTEAPVMNRLIPPKIKSSHLNEDELMGKVTIIITCFDLYRISGAIS